MFEGFDEADVRYVMVEGQVYLNGEELVYHLKNAVHEALVFLDEPETLRYLDQGAYAITHATISGMAGVGMWLEQGIIKETTEKFRESLDKGIPEE